MAELILHHYDLSPFGEKVRLALGLKNLAWRSVEVPIWPPRPELEPLTAGYRRTPVLQIGADIYCDTLLILRTLERLAPEPTLYPGGQAALVAALGWWADTTMFLPAATLATSIIGDGVPQAFLDDRIAFMKHDFSKAASERDLPQNRQRVAAQIALLAGMLQDGRAFLLGDAPSAADLAAYHPLWFACKNGGAAAEAMLPLDPLRGWMARIAAFGHGQRTPMTPQEALEAASHAQPGEAGGVAAGDPSGLKGGDAVLVRADAENDPIRGTLVAADEAELVIRQEDPRTGAVHVYLPRFGYSAVAAGG